MARKGGADEEINVNDIFVLGTAPLPASKYHFVLQMGDSMNALISDDNDSKQDDIHAPILTQVQCAGTIGSAGSIVTDEIKVASKSLDRFQVCL